MTIDLFTATGTKAKSLHLPETLFTGEVNGGLMHQAVLMQQGNRRRAIAHVKVRGEVVGSTKKLFQQKHTGRARRGPIRSPLMKGGGKAFGPRSEANFTRKMPKAMRHAALRSCLSHQLKHGSIVGLESYPTEVKTKTLVDLMKKLPLKSHRNVLIVWGEENRGLTLSARNVSGVKTISAAYLNPEDVLKATAIIFLEDAIAKADALFGRKSKPKVNHTPSAESTTESAPEKKPAKKKTATKTATAKKTSARSAK